MERSLKIFAKKYGIYATGNHLLKNPLIILIQDINIGYRYHTFLLNTRRVLIALIKHKKYYFDQPDIFTIHSFSL